MAVALGVALLMPAPMALAVFLMLGLGLALPYLAVSLSPALLRRLPRPGPWMDRLKGILAFPMYGTALWLVWVFSRQVGADGLALLLASALVVALGLWLLGAAQGDRTLGRRGTGAAVAGGLALAIGVALTVFAVRVPAMPVGAGTASSALPSAPWSADAVAAARGEGRVVLVNFTADWCVTCKINEGAALASPRVAEALVAADAVYLVGDWTRRDDAITRELERHGRSGVPLYLVYAPGSDAPRILPQLLTEGLVIDALNRSRP
jgi:thiol:disulfide interchange protein DsbD